VSLSARRFTPTWKRRSREYRWATVLAPVMRSRFIIDLADQRADDAIRMSASSFELLQRQIDPPVGHCLRCSTQAMARADRCPSLQHLPTTRALLSKFRR
jgi:hypothetical protein